MASLKHKTCFLTWMFLLILYQEVIHCRSVTTKKLYDLKHKSTVKTLKEDKNSDIIDCVDIYKQPAFNHSLVNALQMVPSSYPVGFEVDSRTNLGLIPNWFRKWFKAEECPKGTIPIRRSTISSNHKRSSEYAIIQHQYNQSFQSARNDGHEYALVSDEGRSSYYGGHVSINLWNPKTKNNEMSVSQIWIVSTGDNPPQTLNTIEAGWIVHPTRYGDTQTRFFIFWTADGYQKTGCFDLDCPGFVQTDRTIVIGSPIKPISTYGGNQFEASITIFKDQKTGNWWLHFQGVMLGYWPNSIFTSLADHANTVNWGGEILNLRTGGHHTTTEMGSGHFPSEDYGKASFMHSLKVIDSGNVQRDPGYLRTKVSNPTCYDISTPKNHGGDYGITFFYGGSGYSSSCN